MKPQMNRLLAVTLAGFGLFGSGAARSALIDQGNGTILDNVLNIQWMQLANTQAQTDWTSATAWASGLVFAGFDDWRLPSVDVNGDNSMVSVAQCQASELACRDNEFAYMYYWNAVKWSTPGPISLQFAAYWAQEDNGGNASVFNMVFGDVSFNGVPKDFDNALWAVRDAAVVPEPAGLLLVGIGLAGLGFSRRKAK